MANKKNYNKISTEKTVDETPVETTEVVEEIPVEEATPEAILANGVVANCTRLNVRKDPKKNGEILKTINAKTKVVVNMNESTKTWFKLAGGETGYVMKDYITLVD